MQTALADEHREIDIKHISTLSFSKHICVKGIWGSQIIPDLESLDGPPDGGEFVPVGSI
jgi:nicotinamidase-related amidase